MAFHFVRDLKPQKASQDNGLTLHERHQEIFKTLKKIMKNKIVT